MNEEQDRTMLLLCEATLDELLAEVSKRVKRIYKTITTSPPQTLNGQTKWFQKLNDLAEEIK